MDFKKLLLEHQRLIGLLLNSNTEEQIQLAVKLLQKSLVDKKPVLIMGNGGSASDAAHIAGELVGKFLLERPALNVICLNSNTSVLTAWANDFEYETVFSRQVEAHGNFGGICWGISTSGNSKNVVKAFEQARKMKMITIGLTGLGGGALAKESDLLIEVPSRDTPRIQELHILIYHHICEQVERLMSEGAP
jgi:D-sedoheptulose 7-phosphate isomerase